HQFALVEILIRVMGTGSSRTIADDLERVPRRAHLYSDSGLRIRYWSATQSNSASKEPNEMTALIAATRWTAHQSRGRCRVERFLSPWTTIFATRVDSSIFFPARF